LACFVCACGRWGYTDGASQIDPDVDAGNADEIDASVAPVGPCTWSYPLQSYTLAQGVAAAGIAPSPGCPQDGYSDLDGLPSGLTLDPNTGEISGTPSAAVDPAATYQIRGTTIDGDQDVSLSLRVVAATVVSSQAELEAAINSANITPGEQLIYIADGTYVLNGSLPTITEGLSIIGSSPANTVLDGDNLYRHFRVDLLTPGTVTFSNLTLQNGNFLTSSGSIGIWGPASTVISDCRFLNNTAGDVGGAIRISYALGSSMEVHRSHFEGNVAGEGGAALGTGGGGIDRLIIKDSSFINNSSQAVTAGIGGGAIRLQDIYDEGRIERSLFSGNSSQIQGGAIDAEGVLDITNSTFVANSAPRGGALHVDGTRTVDMSHTTLADNTSTDGSALAISGGVLRLDSILLARHGGDACSGAGISSRGNNFYDADDPDCNFNQDSDVEHSDLMLSTSLADNGGTTPTLALNPGSPAIDGAAVCPIDNVDQRGLPRPADGDGDSTETCDVGAFELQP
jgi:predicted outer membrane repeat protein